MTVQVADYGFMFYGRNGTNTVTLNPKPGYAAMAYFKKNTSPPVNTVLNYAQNTAVLSGQNINAGGCMFADQCNGWRLF